jgi:WD40 repeat protein/tRNA A-37 threonylcarbamoyl transferase component Bud32
MVVADTHPSNAELQAYTLGKLDESSYLAVDAHLSACPGCQERAAVAPDDSLVELLRRVHSQTGAAIDTASEVAQAVTIVPISSEGQQSTLSFPVATDAAETEDLEVIPPELSRHERYRVVCLLGAGGMGEVYKAEHRVMHRAVALKVINRAYTSSRAAVERFRREVRAAARLSHPNIVTTYDAEDAGTTLFLAMEFVEGISLGRRVKERGPLSVAEACDCIRQAALGLQHAHERGMVHRDVKPDNLIRCLDGTVKVLDFGLAALAAERNDGLTDTNVVMGTPDFMAPEQAEDARSADIRADVYSLGCTLYFLLTGSVPYPADTPQRKILAHRDRPVPSLRRAVPDIPPRLAFIVERMLAKKPENRFQTPGEVAAALAPFATVAVPPPPKKRRRVLVATLALVLLAGIGFGGAMVHRIQTDTGELVIKTDSDDVEVVVKQGGKVVRIIDGKTGKEIVLALHSGEYELELKGAPKGLRLNIDKATLTRGETVLAKIERVEKVGKSENQPLEKVGEIRSFGRGTPPILRMALSPDGQHLLTGSIDGSARYWDIGTGKEIYQLQSNGGHVYGLGFSPDGKKLFTAGVDPVIRVWDAATGKEVKRLVGHTGHVFGVAVSPDGRMVASAGWWDHTLRLWNFDTGDLISTPGGHKEWANGVAFSPDGKLIATWACDKTIRLWDVKDQKEILCLKGHTEKVVAAMFSSDGNRLLSGSWENQDPGSIKLWEVKTGKLLQTINNIPGGVHGLAWSADGRQALSGGSRGLVQLWDLESGKEIIAFEGYIGGVAMGAAFLPGGRTALSIGGDRHTSEIRLWRLPDFPARKDKP